MLVQIERGGSGTSSPPISRGSNRWPSSTQEKKTNKQTFVAFGSASVSFNPFQCMSFLLVLFGNFMSLGLIFACQRSTRDYHWIFYVSTLVWSGSKWFERHSSELSSNINIYRLAAQTLCLLATDYYRLLCLGKPSLWAGNLNSLWGNPTKIHSRMQTILFRICCNCRIRSISSSTEISVGFKTQGNVIRIDTFLFFVTAKKLCRKIQSASPNINKLHEGQWSLLHAYIQESNSDWLLLHVRTWKGTAIFFQRKAVISLIIFLIFNCRLPQNLCARSGHVQLRFQG